MRFFYSISQLHLLGMGATQLNRFVAPYRQVNSRVAVLAPALTAFSIAFSCSSSPDGRHRKSAANEEDTESRALQEIMRDALSAYGSGALEESASLLARYVQQAPDSPLAWYRFGNVHLRRNDPEEALECFDRSIDLAPSSAPRSAHIGRGIALTQLGRHREAISALKFAIDLPRATSADESIVTEAHYHLGIAYRQATSIRDSDSWALYHLSKYLKDVPYVSLHARTPAETLVAEDQRIRVILHEIVAGLAQQEQ